MARTAEPPGEVSLEHRLVVRRIGEAFARQAQDSGFHLAAPGTIVRDDETSEEYIPELVLLSRDSEIRTVLEVTEGSGVNQVYGQRARCYRQIPSVEHYVIASSDKPQVAWFSRLNDGRWLFGTAEDLQAEIRLESLNVVLSMAEIYEGVFTADEASA